MPNPLEAFWNTLKGLAQNEPETPLHVGEVMGLWIYQTAITEMLRFEEIGLNMTNDDETVDMLKDAHKLCLSQSRRLEAFLLKEGVPIEDSSPKPETETRDIPEGVKITEDELANGVSAKIASAIVECAMGQAESIRSDVGLLWAEFQSEMLSFSTTLKQLMKKRGWLKVPPYYESKKDNK